ncbi:MAG: UDP-N-acetylglucosamine pyrophosphorylase [Lachnospiraceae bacterium]|nr:UDP-N-acetylglucosamine pyrophosphorylase [Lachnospiraceae bacterium]
MEIFKSEKFLDMTHTIASPLFEATENPWGVLPLITDFIKGLGPMLGPDYEQRGEDVWVHNTAVIAPTAYIGGPTIIGPNTQLRHCAFIRGSAVIGEGCVIGNSVEVKNSIIFDGCEVPHFNYVGDSVLGYKAHMGAGAITSNVKNDKTNVVVSFSLGKIDTHLRKFGAVIGDYAQVGCNSVLNPGTIISRNVSIYPCSCVRGMVNEGVIYKEGGRQVQRVKIKKEMPKGAFEIRN